MGQSDIVTKFQPDAPIILNAEYDRGDPDRRYIDDQILGTQQMLADGLLNGVVCSWFMLSPAAAALAPGQVFCGAADGLMAPATAANLAVGGTWVGVAVTSASPGSTFRGAIDGLIPQKITLLGPGTASKVRANPTTARLERIATPSGGDVLVGTSSTTGAVMIRADGVPGQNAPVGVTSVNASAPVLSASWVDQLVLLTNGFPQTVTIPTDATVAIPTAKVIRFMWYGPAQPSFAPVDGTVLIRSAESLKLRKRFSQVALTKLALNDWALAGDLELA